MHESVCVVIFSNIFSFQMDKNPHGKTKIGNKNMQPKGTFGTNGKDVNTNQCNIDTTHSNAEHTHNVGVCQYQRESLSSFSFSLHPIISSITSPVRLS